MERGLFATRTTDFRVDDPAARKCPRRRNDGDGWGRARVDGCCYRGSRYLGRSRSASSYLGLARLLYRDVARGRENPGCLKYRSHAPAHASYAAARQHAPFSTGVRVARHVVAFPILFFFLISPCIGDRGGSIGLVAGSWK